MISHSLNSLIRPTVFAAKYPDLMSITQLRWILARRAENGLQASGAVVRKGRSLWIDASRFRDWLCSVDPVSAPFGKPRSN